MKLILRVFIITCCFLFFCPKLNAQHSVLLLNGKQKALRAYDVRGEFLIYSKPGDRKGRTRKMYLDRIYSISDSVLGERIVYLPDTTDTFELNKTEMRIFIQGEQYAMLHYKKPWNAVGGAAAGVGGGFLNFYGLGLFIPFGYGAIAGSHSPRVPVNLPDAPANVHDEIFQDGYQYKGRKIKVKDSLIFGGIGFVAGFTALKLLK